MKTVDMSLVKRIWEYSQGRFASTATIHREAGGRFRETIMPKQDVPDVWIQTPMQDIFFSALTFCREQRANDAFCGSRILFADLDGSHPESIDADIRPTIAWETSYLSFQAVWVLVDPIGAYEPWANLNKRMTIASEADRGGWQGSKLLRVPGSANYKRTRVDHGDVLWDDGATYKTQWLETRLPELKQMVPPASARMPDLELEVDFRKEVISQSWADIGLKARSMLMQDHAKDRSLHIVKTIYELKRSGVDNEHIFYMIWWAPWNKWRPNQPERLWQEIAGATL